MSRCQTGKTVVKNFKTLVRIVFCTNPYYLFRVIYYVQLQEINAMFFSYIKAIPLLNVYFFSRIVFRKENRF